MPLFVTEENEVQSDRARRYMRTEAQVSDSGALVAKTRTWTRQPAIGFTGGVDIFLVQNDGIIVAHTGIRQFGVDGFRIPFKKSDRTEVWFHTFSAEEVARATALDVYHLHAPRDRFNDIVGEIMGKGGKVLDVATYFTGRFRGF